ncbi:carboxypeptidase-like regulatory domain-containing protein [Hymenobacter sp. 5317J-9]|uniref:carboxypeptidase-like regulatory domain-containing protein n=1 Tax=Hymenobacter sp. 5317J-9 TaxID=2932250 RepID=UPI001FD6C6EA|nr:carboxypeptidase-like regulatory domain-containing protein [Hymenobacter sp. 5317J-9]UOQ97025.1 carboxypeptidase-like regulatory domain-containing protein [Hymenobacter sp. 5317J-9]
MRFLLLLFCGVWLLPHLALAQTTVSGRVLDAETGNGLFGVTVLQTGTLNGVSADAEGRFSLTLPSAADSIALTFYYIGYVTQQRRVAAGSTSIVRLVVDTKQIIDCEVVQPLAEVGLSSGLRYAPFGGALKLYGSRLARLPITASVGYQTNFSSNQVVTAGLNIHSIQSGRHFVIYPSLDYQHLRAAPANLLFSSYTATASTSIHGIGAAWLPNLLLGCGYAQFTSLTAETPTTVAGYGYVFGLSSSELPLNLVGSAQATHWPGGWQWQARLQHYLPGHLLAGVAFNQVRSYAELSLTVSRTLY